MTFRSYELNLLRQFLAHNQVKRARSVTTWSPICDVILAFLTCQYGFGNYRIFAHHPVWSTISDHSLNQKNSTLQMIFQSKASHNSRQGFSALCTLLFNVELDEKIFRQVSNGQPNAVHLVLRNLFKEVSNQLEDKLMSLLGKLRQQNLQKR